MTRALGSLVFNTLATIWTGQSASASAIQSLPSPLDRDWIWNVLRIFCKSSCDAKTTLWKLVESVMEHQTIPHYPRLLHCGPNDRFTSSRAKCCCLVDTRVSFHSYYNSRLETSIDWLRRLIAQKNGSKRELWEKHSNVLESGWAVSFILCDW